MFLTDEASKYDLKISWHKMDSIANGSFSCNRCTKPVARAAARVLIVFARGSYCICLTWLWNQTSFNWNAILQYCIQTHTAICLARHLRFHRAEVSLEVSRSHASVRSFCSSWTYRSVFTTRTHVVWLFETIWKPDLSFIHTSGSTRATRTPAHIMSGWIHECIQPFNIIRGMQRFDFVMNSA